MNVNAIRNSGNFFSRLQRIIVRTIIAVLEMSGILLDKLSAPRIFLLLLIAFEIVAFNYLPVLNTYYFSIWYAIIWFVVRQGFLFLSFTDNGVATYIKQKWGEERGSELYMLITAFSFWYRARSYSLLLKHTSWDLFPELQPAIPVLFEVYGIQITALSIVSYIFIVFGTVVNIWCFLLVKREAYYYMDMFYGRFLTDFKKSGPYKWFANPMYGVGQLPSYGVALAVGSVSGIVMSFLNQVFAYVFYYLLEKPHIQRCLARIGSPMQKLP